MVFQKGIKITTTAATTPTLQGDSPQKMTHKQRPKASSFSTKKLKRGRNQPKKFLKNSAKKIQRKIIFVRKKAKILQYLVTREFKAVLQKEFNFIESHMSGCLDKICQVVIKNDKFIPDCTKMVYAISSNGLLQCVDHEGRMIAFRQMEAKNRFYEALEEFKGYLLVSGFEARDDAGANILTILRVNLAKECFDLVSEVEILSKGTTLKPSKKTRFSTKIRVLNDEGDTLKHFIAIFGIFSQICSSFGDFLKI